MICDVKVATCASTTEIGSIEIPNVAVTEETFAPKNVSFPLFNNFVPNGFGFDGIIVPRRRKIALGFSFERLIKINKLIFIF